jgi:putative glutamine amidotransferase
MRILISQRDINVPPSFFTFDALERSWYNFFHKHYLIPVPNLSKIDETVDFDCLVLTGGPDSIERHLTENLLFEHANELGKPIVGFCHGAFAINDLTGGINGTIENHIMTDHLVYFDGKEFLVNSYHGQSIDKLGPNMIQLAHDEEGIIEAFKHKEKPIYGIVWHPERMENPILPTEVKNILGL